MVTVIDDNGRFDPLPTVESIAQYAAPFPAFDADGDWQVAAAVHRLTEDYVARRVAE